MISYKCKLFSWLSSRYSFDVIPTATRPFITKNDDKLPYFKVKHNYFKNVFPSTVIDWNKLDLNICNSKSLTSFKDNILNFIRPSKKGSFFVIIQKEYNY